MNKILSIIKLLRPTQWVKNAFIFIPLFFSGNIFNFDLLLECLISFISFSFAASSIYCLNDLKDVEVDRIHPEKRLRPIASGKVSKKEAISVFIILTILWILIPILLLSINPPGVTALIAAYVVLNILYCYALKQYPIIDVFIISAGFVIRLVVGGFCTDLWLSPWIVCLTFLLALFLAFAKRRDDVIISRDSGIEVRKSSRNYNTAFLNSTLGIIASVTLVCYLLFCMSPDVINRFHTEFLYITALFVLAGLLRYLQVAIVDLKSGSPTKVLMKDRFIQICILCWIISFVIIIYCN